MILGYDLGSSNKPRAFCNSYAVSWLIVNVGNTSDLDWFQAESSSPWACWLQAVSLRMNNLSTLEQTTCSQLISTLAHFLLYLF